MALCSASFETGVDGATITTGDAGAATAWDSVSITGPATLTYDNDHPAYGALAGKISMNAQIAYAGWTTAFGTQTEHYGRIYYYATALNNTVNLVQMFDGGFAGTQACRLQILQTAFNLTIQDTGATVRATSTTVFVINTPYRIEWRVRHATGAGSFAEAKIFIGGNVEGITPNETISCSDFNLRASTDAIRFGQSSVGNNGTFWMDEIIAGATSYPGPVTGTSGSSVMVPRHGVGMGRW